VRETVYNGLLKRMRANLHIGFVRWADKVNADRDRALEFQEILGYHLEQAHRYLRELGPLDVDGVAIGTDAARRLSSAAKRAFARGDMHAAANLYRRALALLAEHDPDRVALLPAFGETLMGVGDFAEARLLFEEARVAADRVSNHRVKAQGQLMGLYVRLFTGEMGDRSSEVLRTVEELIPLLQQESAHNELATAWRLIMVVHAIATQHGPASEAAQRSIEQARLAGNHGLVEKISGTLSSFALLGPMPVLQAIAQCESAIADGMSDRQVECSIMCALAQLKAMNGELEAARLLYRRGRAVLHDLGQGLNAAATGLDLARVELHGGDLAMAEREVRADYDFLVGIGETYYLSTMAALLSRVVRDQGRDDEALVLSKIAEEATSPDDIESQALWRSIRAPIVARAGNMALAEELARTALDYLRPTNMPSLQADALIELASVLKLAGRTGECRQIIDEAFALYSAKGNIVLTARSASLGADLAGVG
jgi:tetratricopeptide (TPR) repeat protein